jgi:hypothetical protein
MAVAGGILFPLFAEALATWLTRGRDDEDDFMSSYWKYVGGALLSFTDLTDASWKALQGDAPEITAATVLRSLAAFPKGAGAIAEGNFGQFFYHAAEFVTTWAGVPVLTAYDRIIRQVEDWNDDDVDTLFDWKEAADLKKPNRKKGGI